MNGDMGYKSDDNYDQKLDHLILIIIDLYWGMVIPCIYMIIHVYTS
jgi:hypothetical protein